MKVQKRKMHENSSRKLDRRQMLVGQNTNEIRHDYIGKGESCHIYDIYICMFSICLYTRSYNRRAHARTRERAYFTNTIRRLDRWMIEMFNSPWKKRSLGALKTRSEESRKLLTEKTTSRAPNMTSGELTFHLSTTPWRIPTYRKYTRFYMQNNDCLSYLGGTPRAFKRHMQRASWTLPPVQEPRGDLCKAESMWYNIWLLCGTRTTGQQWREKLPLTGRTLNLTWLSTGHFQSCLCSVCPRVSSSHYPLARL